MSDSAVLPAPVEVPGIEQDSQPAARHSIMDEAGGITLLRSLPILIIHAMCLGVIWVGFSWVGLGVAIALYVIRMFVITGFYHRYFSHRTFKTHRITQAVFAFIGTTCAQRGPIWWSSHHRDHHRYSDEKPDIHSPVQRSFFWSHMGWFLSERGMGTNRKSVPDLLKVPELMWIDKWHLFGPLTLIAAMYLLGWALQTWAPGLHTNGLQMVVWGFAISTAVLYHGTFTINSLAHTIGSRRFRTSDDSRNNFFLALLTLGEGWHNNHHYYPGTARQGFYWWEIDLTFYTLLVMEKLGLVWDVRRVPESVYAAAKKQGEDRRFDRSTVR